MIGLLDEIRVNGQLLGSKNNLFILPLINLGVLSVLQIEE